MTEVATLLMTLVLIFVSVWIMVSTLTTCQPERGGRLFDLHLVSRSYSYCRDRKCSQNLRAKGDSNRGASLKATFKIITIAASHFAPGLDST
jgi:hypothetical protein